MGTNGGPDPGILGRGALGSCLAIGCGTWAARLGVPIDALTVVVQGDYDGRGELGVADDVSPGYLQVGYRVTVTSQAPEADVQGVLIPLTNTARIAMSTRGLKTSVEKRRSSRAADGSAPGHRHPPRCRDRPGSWLAAP